MEAFKALDRSQDSQELLSQEASDRLKTVREELEQILDEIEPLRGCVDKLWSVGPRKCGPNLLFNGLEGFERSNFWDIKQRSKGHGHKIADYDSSVIGGFQLATLQGPLCEEPMMGVAFIITSADFAEDKAASDLYGPLSGQIISTVKEGCRKAFQRHPQRLMAAMYSCEIATKAEVLGRLYASLGKRHGKIVSEDMVEGSSTFTVTAHLPVIESLQFAQEIRKQTQGLAMPQLVFSHWETVELDPFWVPSTEEEILHFGDKADSENHARRYMNELRKKKGLNIDEKIVEFAEKQRTLTKSK